MHAANITVPKFKSKLKAPSHVVDPSRKQQQVKPSATRPTSQDAPLCSPNDMVLQPESNKPDHKPLIEGS